MGSAMGGVGAGMGAASAGLGMLGAKRQRKDWKKMLEEVRGEKKGAIEKIEGREAGFAENPLLQLLQQQYMESMDAGPNAGERRGLFDLAQGGLQDLFAGPYGLSDPRVRENIYSSAVENALLPEFQQSERDMESRLSARGLGRSGLAEQAGRQRDFAFDRSAADLRRTVETEGEMATMQDLMTKIGAASGLYGQAEDIAGKTRGQAGQFGLQSESLLNNLAQMIANIRMQYAGMRAGQPAGPNVYSAGAQGLGSAGQGFQQWGRTINQDPLYQGYAQNYWS